MATERQSSPYLLVDVSGGEVGLQPALRIFVGVVVRQAKLFLHLIILVVASVDDDGRVVADTLDLSDAFCFNRVSELPVGWVITTAKHKVLPDKNAEFVACVVEDVFLPDSSAPDTAGHTSVEESIYRYTETNRIIT
jgi:hypothetical protein